MISGSARNASPHTIHVVPGGNYILCKNYKVSEIIFKRTANKLGMSVERIREGVNQYSAAILKVYKDRIGEDARYMIEIEKLSSTLSHPAANQIRI